MKVKDLLKALENANPETFVQLRVQDACHKAITCWVESVDKAEHKHYRWDGAINGHRDVKEETVFILGSFRSEF